jgi:hypothetical protein
MRSGSSDQLDDIDKAALVIRRSDESAPFVRCHQIYDPVSLP